MNNKLIKNIVLSNISFTEKSKKKKRKSDLDPLFPEVYPDQHQNEVYLKHWLHYIDFYTELYKMYTKHILTFSIM